MYDIAIVGAGPAGLSAAMTARARDKSVLLVSNPANNSPLAKAQQIDNYPGMPAVSGLDLLTVMTEQAVMSGVELVNDRVISAMTVGQAFSLTTGDDIYEARALILALGAQKAKPLPGEMEYLGRGVSYCATCDGMLYRGRRVIVYGLHDEAVIEANFLADIGCDVAYIAPVAPEGLVASIDVHIGRITGIIGDALGMTSVSYRVPSRENTRTDSDQEIIECQGIFILRPTIAPNALINGIELLDGFIKVGNDMSTGVSGIYAAGDCIGKPFQIAKAVGEGQIAALAADEYLHKKA
ncbi:MAG: NAD(P)/FAD-dependent oxidoreductase [Coriobacteriales bacterium]|jgi:thioredoxin reductase (NADPH)|nr:NAD(P)/FAD-dependent oxidoreductase [Coriobacteriales bacterium]